MAASFHLITGETKSHVKNTLASHKYLHTALISKMRFLFTCSGENNAPLISPYLTFFVFAVFGVTNYPYLTRDLRLQVLTLHEHGFSYTQIAKAKGLTYRQVYYTCKQGVPSPRKRTGRPPTLSEEQVKILVNYVCASLKNRQLSFDELAEKLPFGVGAYTIRSALRKAGFQQDHSPWEKEDWQWRINDGIGCVYMYVNLYGCQG
ncbi:conserved hypothetical protein [Microsporum canis CBS 113480]|uniref:Transposase Tc1-like domain-containing protein n=1 Tax=Arthroderma otae (strain ATCC MYA-4605 / CBS 113480) TaxID=554155 RepID=C5FFU1_ARTOC|nr:conserved hypothetical protein [Microsporum canis CBS 113480]EEQ29626.1 conserved hypothetical protein [Microsporum canis CBS 113480]